MKMTWHDILVVKLAHKNDNEERVEIVRRFQWPLWRKKHRMFVSNSPDSSSEINAKYLWENILSD